MFIAPHVHRKWECKLSPVCLTLRISFLGEEANSGCLAEKGTSVSFGPGESAVSHFINTDQQTSGTSGHLVFEPSTQNWEKTQQKKKKTNNPKSSTFCLSLWMFPSSSWFYAGIQDVVGLVIRNVAFSIGSENDFKTYGGKPGKFCCLILHRTEILA